MKFIAHRGNLTEKENSKENSPDHIHEAISKGYDAEIDVWFINGVYFLGHDEPVYKISPDFLIVFKKFLWCHAKNYEALDHMRDLPLNFFWHTDEDYVLTSKGNVWVYPGKPLLKQSVAVLPETASYTIKEMSPCCGICSDNITYFKDLYNGY